MVALGKLIARNYFKFSGRLSRPEYWGFVGLIFMASILAIIVNSLIFGPEMVTRLVTYRSFTTGEVTQILEQARVYSGGYFGVGLSVLVGIPFLASTLRRLRDSGATLFSAFCLWTVAIVFWVASTVFYGDAYLAGVATLFDLPGLPINADVTPMAAEAIYVMLATSAFTILWTVFWLASPSSIDDTRASVIVV